MPTVRRKDFIEARVGRQLDLNKAKNDPEFRAKLQAAGFKLEDLDKLDLYGHDGVVRGPRELRALFDMLKALDGGGSAKDAVALDKSGNRGWVPTNAGKAYEAFDSEFERGPLPPPPPRPDAAALARFPLAGPVGRGGANRREDVQLVQRKLRDVGFDITPDGQFGPRTENALKVYRGMLDGTDDVTELDGRIEPGDIVHVALAQDDPPRWVAMPRRGTGFVNDDTDGFSHGSSETVKMVEEVGAAYARDYQATRPGAAPLSLNDVSTRSGGKTADHQSHQNGLDLDLRLPKRDGTSGSTVRASEYDREATWAMLSALGNNERVERILFADPTLQQRAIANREPWAHKLIDGGPIHNNHIHVDVKPPDVT